MQAIVYHNDCSDDGGEEKKEILAIITRFFMDNF